MRVERGVINLSFNVIVLTGFLLGTSAFADEHKVYQISLPAQNVAESLTSLSEQTDVLLLFPYETARQLKANPVNGKYTLSEALEIMLKGTGYSGGLSKKGVLMISLTKSHSAKDKRKTEGEVMKINRSKKKTTLFAGLAAFFTAAVTTSNVTAQEPDTRAASGGVLEEVIVTANKRATGTSIQDFAGSISAVSGDDISKKSLVSNTDYLTSIPGVNIVEAGPAQGNSIVMRGLSTTYGEGATTSSYLGDVLLTNPYAGGGTNIKLVDIERVEILRGPQGTLYGSATLSGAVRNVPVLPKLNEIEGRIETGLFDRSGSGELGDKLTGVVNLPLVEDKLAVRLVAYRYDNPGYIDWVTSPLIEQAANAVGAVVDVRDDVNGSTFTGGRITLLWQPTDRLTATVMWLKQKIDHGSNDLLEFESGGNEFVRQVDRNNSVELFEEVDIANIALTYDLSWATLNLSSSYINTDGAGTFDLFPVIPALPATANFLRERSVSTHELRLASNSDSPVQYVVGFYYEDHDYDSPSFWDWDGDEASLIASGLGAPGAGLDSFERRFDVFQDVEQKAFFGEVGYAFNEQWELTFGARYFDYDRVGRENTFLSGVIENNRFPTTESGNIYKLNLSYTPNDDSLIYAQYSQGFRLGKGIAALSPATCDTDNDGINDGTGLPFTDQLDSDTTDNFELGGKFTLLDNRLTLNAALYHVKWTNLPITVRGPGNLCNSTMNGGEARSRGAELEINYYATPELRLMLAANYNDAELTEDSSIGNAGDRLSNAPRANGNIGLEYDFELMSHPAFARADYNYVGSFTNSVNGSELGDYGKLSVRLGININRFDIAIYGTNLTNENAVTVDFGSSFNTPIGVRLEPRVLGMDVSYQF